jgi:hypothetical protein
MDNWNKLIPSKMTVKSDENDEKFYYSIFNLAWLSNIAIL